MFDTFLLVLFSVGETYMLSEVHLAIATTLYVGKGSVKSLQDILLFAFYLAQICISIFLNLSINVKSATQKVCASRNILII